MKIIGLTGSIGMGKSTVAHMFSILGYPIQDADKIVHDLYENEEKLILEISRLFPGVVEDQKIDRQALGQIVFQNPEKLAQLEKVIHPYVRMKREEFLDKSRRQNAEIAILDIPLLFEKGLDKECDVTISVRCPERIQRQRVLARPGMTEEKFNHILKQQMPIRQKIARSDFVIQTGLNKGHTMQELKKTVATILSHENTRSGQMTKSGFTKHDFFGRKKTAKQTEKAETRNFFKDRMK